MKRFALTIVLVFISAVVSDRQVSAGMITVDFDDDSKWLRAPSTAISSYSSNHQYVDQGFTFTGGQALRDSTSIQDGFPSALGAFSWRLRDQSSVSWTATYSSINPAILQIGRVSFDARRWDGVPSPAFEVSFSIDGGTNFSASQVTLNNSTFNNSSDWRTFSFFANTPVLGAGDFVVRFAATGTTERIMIDNFSVTAVPEPTSVVMVALAGMGGLMARRFKSYPKTKVSHV